MHQLFERDNSSAHSCVCMAGWSHRNGSCVAFEVGKYKPSTGLSACIGCLAGETSSVAAYRCVCTESWSLSVGKCVGCIPGKYKPTNGSSTCTHCDIGKTSHAFAKSCFCSAGWFPTIGTCVACAAGTYKASLGSGLCMECGVGTTSEALYDRCVCSAGWSTSNGSCVACVTGKYKPGPGSAPCTDCVMDSYLASDRTECLLCPANMKSASASGALTDCSLSQCGDAAVAVSVNAAQLCDIGGMPGTCSVHVKDDARPLDTHYLLDGDSSDTAGSFVSDCGGCPGNYYNLLLLVVVDLGRSYCISHVETWSPIFSHYFVGLVMSVSDSLEGQSTHSRSTATQRVCSHGVHGQQRYHNTYCAAGATSRYFCVRRSAWGMRMQELKIHAMICQCAPGFYSTDSVSCCKMCLANTVSVAGSVGLADCVCAAGWTGANSTCVCCEAGKYKPSSRSTLCIDCPMGKTSNASAPSCLICTAGWSTANAKECVGCIPGKYKTQAGSQACTDCGAGTFSEAVNFSVNTCENCTAGTYSMDNKTHCAPCLNSDEPPASDSITNCVCNAGWSGPNSPCVVCVAGKYKTDAGPHACIHCAAGKFSDSVTSSTQDNCMNCSAGSRSTQNRVSCDVCPSGSYSMEGESQC